MFSNSPNCLAKVDFPAPPGPITKTLFMFFTSNSTDSAIAVDDQLAGLERVFFKQLQPRRKNHPRLLAGSPEITLRQIRELAPQTINVLRRRKQPQSIRRRHLFTLAQTT